MGDTQSAESHKLASGRLVARNTILNGAGQTIPMVFGLFAIPLLVKGLGPERFGILTLIWIMIGYFSFLDFGIDKALTQIVAKKLGIGEDNTVPAIICTGLTTMLVLSIIGTVITLAFSKLLIYSIFKVPAGLQKETLYSFYLIAFSIPAIVVSVGLSGALAAKQHFGLINAVRIPFGAYTFLGPLFIVSFSRNLIWLTLALLLGRVVTLGAYLFFCLRVFPALRRRWVSVNKTYARQLLSYGSWMTVTNIVSPIMVNMDRFFISAMISMSAVAYYSTPFEIVARIKTIPVALVATLFPAFSSSYVKNYANTVSLFKRGLKFTFLSIFPIVLVLTTFAHEGIRAWLGTSFADNCTTILRLLTGGVFVNCLALIPFALIQGVGRPDITAKFHLMELPFYVLLLWVLAKGYGLTGVAIAWVVRAAVDAMLLFYYSRRFLGMASVIDWGGPRFLPSQYRLSAYLRP